MKKRNNNPTIVYYQDELNDDFAGNNIKTKVIDKNFKFIHKNLLWRFFSFIIYYLIAIPVVTFYTVIIKRVKFVNKKALKRAKKHSKKGVFLYGNHTGAIDAYTPNIISFPYRNKIVVSPDAVSIPGIKNIVQMLGGIPVPSDISSLRRFTSAIEYYNKEGCNITIYPEAHIWPFHTGVRNFKDSSFAYPISTNSPVIAFFLAFSEPKGLFSRFRKANCTVFVSDPIFPNTNLPKKEAQKELRDKVFEFMKDCSQKHSTYKIIDYKHISEKPNKKDTTDK